MKTNIKIPTQLTTHKLDKIAFFGSADIAIDHPLYQEVYEIAQQVAKMGKIVVNGGGPGVMQASTQGAAAAGGQSVVITFQPKNMPQYECHNQDNQATTEITTAGYIERMLGLICYADLFICFKGGTGTLSEWATTWLIAHLHSGQHKPLILYGEFWHEVMAVISKNFFIGELEKKVYQIVTNQAELFQAVKDYEQELTARKEVAKT